MPKGKRAEVIAVAMQKGGVGKTTTCANVAAELHLRGYKVLAVDLDAQCNLSRISPGYDREMYTILELMRGDSIRVDGRRRLLTVSDVIQEIEGSYDLIASDKALDTVDFQLLMNDKAKEYRLREVLKPALDDYDYVLIDCQPQLGIRYSNAFTAADKVLVCSEQDDFSTEALADIFATIKAAKEHSNPELEIAGILRTKCQIRQISTREWTRELSVIAPQIGTRLFDTYIRYSSAPMQAAQKAGTCVVACNRTCPVAQDYVAFVDEFLRLEGK